MFRLKSNNLCGLFLLGLSIAGASHAGIVYRALPNQSGASDLNCCLEADDFTLGSSIQLLQVKFWSFQGSASDYSGSIVWSINRNSAGVPGASVASGTATPAGVSTGVSGFGLNEFSYTFPVNVPLVVGTYWVVLHNGPTNTIPGTNFFWEWSNGNAGNSQQQDLSAPGQPWLGNFSELAMELQGVPEPSSMLLLGAGILAVWSTRGRKKN